MKYGFSLWLTVLSLCRLTGQATWEMGVMGGITAYAGDLNEYFYYDYKVREIGYGLLLRRNFGPVFALRLNYLGGKIAGDESHFSDPFWRAERAFKFTSAFHEGSLLLEWDILGYRRRNGWRFRKILSPYVFAGAGYNYFRTRTDYNDSYTPNPIVPSERILADKQAPVPPPTLVLHFGGGLKWDIHRYWILGLEMGMRPVFSDYLDGVSIAGISGNRDWFAFAGITLTQRIREVDSDRDWIPNRRDKCPLSPGPPKYRGCPDADADGIVDDYDECPFVPGVPSARGCPDADGDGLQDSLDLCPLIAGPVSACGCPDRDADHIPDMEDHCPDLPGLHHLDGCPDVDGDSIPDPRDACPYAWGPAQTFGCPDADGDGIADLLDLCPPEPGTWAHLGCPDTDGDGTADYDDLCPDRPGVPAFQGCPDTDGDGIPDYLDRCPTLSGTSTFQGCPDTDGDGIPNPDDKCPYSVGSAANYGCPELKKQVVRQLQEAGKQIQFETGSDRLLPASLPVVERVAEILKDYPHYIVTIAGHTDAVGKPRKNQELSEKRAATCREKLIELGIEPERLKAVGYGQSKPIASNKTAKGRALNRRVEFQLVRLY